MGMDELHIDGDTESRLTEREAEKVIQLWARLQDEKIDRERMPSVATLAEALGTSEEQIERLLQEVRLADRVEPVALETKKRNHVLRNMTITAGIFILFVVGLNAFMISRTATQDVTTIGRPAPVPLSPTAPELASVAPMPYYEVLLPAGVVLRVDGLPIRSNGNFEAPNSEVLSNVVNGLDHLYHEVTAGETVTDYSGKLTGEELHSAIQANRPIDGVVRFIKASAEVDGKTQEVLLPVCLIRHGLFEQIIEDARLERMEQLGDFVKEKHVPKQVMKTIAD